MKLAGFYQFTGFFSSVVPAASWEAEVVHFANRGRRVMVALHSCFH